MRGIKILIISLFCFSSANAQISDPFLKGMADLSMNNYISSIESFSNAIHHNPKQIKCYLNRGIAYYYSNDLKKAEADFKLALEHNENEALVWIAKIQASNNNPVLSTQYLKKYLDLSIAHKNFSILKDNDFQPIHYAKEWQNLVAVDYENNLDKTINEASYYLKKNLLDKGILNLNNAILNNSDKAELYYLRAKFYLASNNIPLALSDGYHAVELEANNPIYIELLADIYSLNNDFEKAGLNYNEALLIKPENFEVYKKLAKAELNNNMFKDAQKTVSTYLLYFNADTSAIFLLADIYFSMGEYQNSLKNLNKLIENFQPHASWFLKRGLCYEETGTLKYAAADLSMCLDIEPNNTSANLHLGNVQLKLGNKESACFYWERALRAGELQATEYLQKYCQ